MLRGGCEESLSQHLFSFPLTIKSILTSVFPLFKFHSIPQDDVIFHLSLLLHWWICESMADLCGIYRQYVIISVKLICQGDLDTIQFCYRGYLLIYLDMDLLSFLRLNFNLKVLLVGIPTFERMYNTKKITVSHS